MAPNFFDDTARGSFVKDMYLAMFALLGMAYVGVNRLSMIPFIVSMFNGLGGIVGWYVYSPGPGGHSRTTTAGVFFAYICYCGGEFAVVMYGYFLLEKLLPVVRSGAILSRRTFLYVFWPLQIANGALRISCIIFATVSYAKGLNDKPLYNIAQTQFLVVCIIEVFTAYLLVVLFRRSRETAVRFLGGKRLGLFKHMLLSTEIRVASIAVVCLVRAGCEQSKRHSASMDAVRLDATAIDFVTLFPMMLVLDCILRKSIGLEINLQKQTEKCHCPGCPEVDQGLMFSGLNARLAPANEKEKPIPYATESLAKTESA